MIMIKKKLLIALLLIPLLANNTLLTTEVDEQSSQQSEATKEKKSSLKPLLLVGAVVIGGGVGTWWGYKWYNSKPEEVQVQKDEVLEKLIKSINKVNIRKDVIIPEDHLLTKDPDYIKVTELNYSNPKLFDMLGVSSDDILLMNGANPSLGFGQGGTNRALSSLITKLTGQKNWGTITDLKGRKRVGNISLGVGGIFISTTNMPNKPKISVMHVLGPNGVNKQSTQNVIRKSMRSAIAYALEKKKHIMVCGVSTGIYSSGEKMTNDMYQACWTGVAASIQIYKSKNPNTPLPSNIYFNLFHRDVIQHITNKKLYTTN